MTQRAIAEAIVAAGRPLTAGELAERVNLTLATISVQTGAAIRHGLLYGWYDRKGFSGHALKYFDVVDMPFEQKLKLAELCQGGCGGTFCRG